MPRINPENTFIVSLVYGSENLFLVRKQPFEILYQWPSKENFDDFSRGIGGIRVLRNRLFFSYGAGGKDMAVAHLDTSGESFKITKACIEAGISANIHWIELYAIVDKNVVEFLVPDGRNDSVFLVRYDFTKERVVHKERLFNLPKLPQHQEDATDVHHINTLCIYDGKVYVTVAHRDEPHANKKYERGDVYVFSFNDSKGAWLDLLGEGDKPYKFIHNYIQMAENEYAVCDSMNGLFVHYNNGVYSQKYLGGFTRGLHIDKSNGDFIVGISPWRPAANWFTPPDKGPTCSSIVRLDRDKLDIKDRLDIPAPRDVCLYAIIDANENAGL